MNSKKIISILLGLITLLVMFSVFYKSNTKVEETSLDIFGTEICKDSYLGDKIKVPEGWYKHNRSNRSVLITKTEELPEIGATELYAYGEQIEVYSFDIQKTPEDWLKGAVDENDVLFISKTWSVIDGYRLLIIEQQSAGGAGNQLTKYVFLGSRVYGFFLYPLEKYENGSYIRNETGLKALDFILSEWFKTI